MKTDLPTFYKRVSSLSDNLTEEIGDDETGMQEGFITEQCDNMNQHRERTRPRQMKRAPSKTRLLTLGDNPQEA